MRWIRTMLILGLLLAAPVHAATPANQTRSPHEPGSPHEPRSLHEHRAPHQGTLVVLGHEAAHLELVLDGPDGVLTCYVLDGEAEQSVRIAQKVIPIRIHLPARNGAGSREAHDLDLAAVANPLTGEAVGDTSEFRVRSNSLQGVSAFDAVILDLTIKGAPFANVSFNFPRGNEVE